MSRRRERHQSLSQDPLSFIRVRYFWDDVDQDQPSKVTRIMAHQCKETDESIVGN